jgi:GntR family transcriptional regulator
MHTRETLLDSLRVEENGSPIYVQLRDQMLRALGRGVLVSGDQMPTMRQVAVALKIDLNTVRHAYDELERLGAIELVRGRGSFVASPPPAPSAAAQAKAAEAFAEQTLATATAQGIDPGALLRHLAKLVKQKE